MALRVCCSSWSTRVALPQGGNISPAAAAGLKGLGWPAGRRRRCGGKKRALAACPLLARDLAALDLDQIDAGNVLGALLTGRALLDEAERSVDALHLDGP